MLTVSASELFGAAAGTRAEVETAGCEEALAEAAIRFVIQFREPKASERATGADRPLSRVPETCDHGGMPNSPRSRIATHEAKLIRDSFEKASFNPSRTSELFYHRLFELDPSVRGLFHGDMREQGRKLMATLTLVVDSIAQLDELLPMVRELGVRHANYRVEERHYATVGDALVWALAQAVGPAFTPATRAAWKKAYDILARTMIEAARAAPLGSAAP